MMGHSLLFPRGPMNSIKDLFHLCLCNLLFKISLHINLRFWQVIAPLLKKLQQNLISSGHTVCTMYVCWINLAWKSDAFPNQKKEHTTDMPKKLLSKVIFLILGERFSS